ncbi:hypothetical protein AA0Z99_10630 [Agrococcus sp. 1P02AA]|uniref:hypothetical protein n=1 Tax=Agrococcus sp. 1P02AA TaxID=3132259 RepID=UPI0039A63F4F
MSPTPSHDTDGARAAAFEREMIAAGTDPAVAAELERRIQVVERDELHDASRQPFSGRELIVYVAVSVAAVVVGIVVVAL